MDDRPAAGRDCMTRQACQDLAAGMIGVCLLAAVRPAMLLAFHTKLGAGTGASQIAAAMANGLRVDLQTVALWLILPFLSGAVLGFLGKPALADRLRRLVLGLYIACTLALSVISWGYFREYDDQFNHFVLLTVHDDLGATLRTVWKAYPIVWIAAGLAVLGWLLARSAFLILPRLASGCRRMVPGRLAGAVPVLGLAALVLAARGSLGSRPIQRKDLAVTADPFLNKMVTNPYRALFYAIRDYRQVADEGGLLTFLPDGDLRGAAARIGLGDRPGNLDTALERTAPGAATPPRHVFLVLLESYSAWPLRERYRPLGITKETARLGDRGVLLIDFLAAGDGTMNSVAPLMTGLPNCGIPINYQPESRRPYPSGAAAIFRRLGYRTRFFYGGYLSWERIGDFARDQGFDEVWGGGNMGDWASGNEWGVNDRELYDFVLRTVRDDRPSFNIVLTVSNHPPYDIDPWEEGFPLRELPAAAAALGDGSFSLKEMGHFWYGDRQFGRFVDGVERILPGVLVAATADHYGRRFLTSRPGVVDQSTVPLLLYSPSFPVAGRAVRPWGSHLDILPTLVGLSAPAGFRYAAFGTSLLDANPRGISFGSGHAVGDGFVADLWKRRSWEALPDGGPPAPPDLEALRHRDNDLKALSWWRVRHGPDLASAAAIRYTQPGSQTTRRRP